MPAFSVDASAANASGTLGVCNIENPEYDSRNAYNDPYPSEYNRVYFGWVQDSTTGMARNVSDNKGYTSVDPYKHNIPIYWRVLYTTANDESTPALFMLTEYSLNTRISWDYRHPDNGGNQRWQFLDNTDNTVKTDSSLRKLL